MKDINYKALQWCVEHSVPFCLLRLPGDSGERFFSAPSLAGMAPQAQSRGCFLISPFDTPCAGAYAIPFELDADRTLALQSAKFKVESTKPLSEPPADTTRGEYLEGVGGLIREMRTLPGAPAKVVLSVVKTETLPGACIADMVRSLLETSPSCMVHCYLHPATGLWLGATPELLLSADTDAGTFRTMALASTVAPGEQWDAKDISEQDIVSTYIKGVITDLGLEYTASEPQNLEYAHLLHRCTVFSGNMGTVAPVTLIDRLNPTPALAGYPLDMALEAIRAIEAHPRLCYGGWVGVSTPGHIDAYVNIRCARAFPGHRFTFYTGGGILPGSDVEAEWEETTRKRMALMEKLRIPIASL